MKRFFAVIILAVCALGAAYAQYDFRAQCPEGQVMYFKILADSATVSVTHPGPNWPYYDPEHRLHGELTVPEQVQHGGRTYRVVEVAPCAFYRNDSITALHLPPCTRIGAQAFCGCTRLSAINLPDGLTLIGDGAFAYCRALTELSIPASVQQIDMNAFSLCYGLQRVAIKKSLFDACDGTVFLGTDIGKYSKMCEPEAILLLTGKPDIEILSR